MIPTYLSSERQKIDFFKQVLEGDLQVYSKTRFCCGTRKFRACKAEERASQGYVLLEDDLLWKIVSPVFDKLVGSFKLEKSFHNLSIAPTSRKVAFEEETSTDIQVTDTTAKLVRSWLDVYIYVDRIKKNPSSFFEIQNAPLLLGKMLQDKRLFPESMGVTLRRCGVSFSSFVKKAVENNDKQNLVLCESVITSDSFAALLKATDAICLAISKGHFNLALYLLNYVCFARGQISTEEKTKIFCEACKFGAVDLLRSMWTKFTMEQADLALGFQNACKEKKTEVIQVLHEKNPYLISKQLDFEEGRMTPFSYAAQKDPELGEFFLNALEYKPSSKEMLFLLSMQVPPIRLLQILRRMPYAQKLIIDTWVTEFGATNEMLRSFFQAKECNQLDRKVFFLAVKNSLKKPDVLVLPQEEFLHRLDEEIPECTMPSYDKVILEKFRELVTEKEKEEEEKLKGLLRIIKNRIRVEGVPCGKELVYYRPLEKILKHFANLLSQEENSSRLQAEIKTAFFLFIEKADLCFTGFLPSFLFVYRTLLSKTPLEDLLCSDESPIDALRIALKALMKNSLNTQYYECMNQNYDTLEGCNAHATAFMLKMLREDGVDVEGVYVDNEDSLNYSMVNFGMHFDIGPELLEGAYRSLDGRELAYKEIKDCFLKLFYTRFTAQFALDARKFLEWQLNHPDEIKRNEFLSNLTDTVEHLAISADNILDLQEGGYIAVDPLCAMFLVQKIF